MIDGNYSRTTVITDPQGGVIKAVEYGFEPTVVTVDPTGNPAPDNADSDGAWARCGVHGLLVNAPILA